MGFNFSQTAGTAGISSITLSATSTSDVETKVENYTLSNDSGSSVLMQVIQKAYEPVEKYINLKPSSIEWNGSGGTSSLQIQSNDNWVITSNSWIELSRFEEADRGLSHNTISGNGNTIIGIRAKENTGATRTGGITGHCISNSAISATTTVVQNAYIKPYIQLSYYSINCDSTGITSSFTITSNVDWHIVVDERWVSVNTESGSGNANIAFTVDENTSSIARSCDIAVYARDYGIKVALVINQDATQLKPYITLNPDRFVVSDKGSTGNTISISSNCSYGITTEANWITLHSSSGSGDGTVTFDTDPAPLVKFNTGLIEFSNSALSRTVTVERQGEETYLSASTRSILSPSSGGSFEVYVYSNVNWAVNIDTGEGVLSENWLSVAPLSGVNDETIRVSVSGGLNAKEGVIELISSKYGLGFKIDVEREEVIDGTKVYYKTNDGFVAKGIETRFWGANMISNTYENGQGIIEFDGDITSVPHVRIYHFEDGYPYEYDYAKYTEFIIPKTVKTLDDSFNDALESGTTINIPNSVTGITLGAFCSNTGITVSIPSSVTSITGESFSNCVDSVIIYNAKNCDAVYRDHRYPFDSASGTLVIGNDVERINDHMFENSKFTGQLYIPDNVTYLGTNAFSASSFTSLRLPENITSIGNYCFGNCTGLTGTLSIPSSVTSIGNNAFWHCSFTNLVGLRSGLTLNGACFMYNSGLTGNLTIPRGLEIAGINNFSDTSYTGITVEDGVIYSNTNPYATNLGGMEELKAAYIHTVNIPNGFLSGANNLKTIHLYSATSIGAKSFAAVSFDDLYVHSQTAPTFGYIDVSDVSTYPFAQSGSRKLTSYVHIPLHSNYSSWKTTNRSNVAYCFFLDGDTTKLYYDYVGPTTNPNVTTGWGATLTSTSQLNYIVTLSFDASPTSIPNNAFSGKQFTTYVLPNTIENIGTGAFKNSKVKKINLDSVIEFGESAFYSCTGLTSVTIGDSTTTIGDYAFQNCTGITTVSLGRSVQRIGYAAFNQAPITTLYSYNSIPPDLGENPEYLFNESILTIHYPVGADYSYWKDALYGATFVEDL